MRINIDDWTPQRLDRVLAALGANPVQSRRVVLLDPHKVLAHAWRPRRLEQCREQLAAGLVAPPIEVVGYRIGRQTFYGVADGMHRTIAAREVGKKIKAEISGFYEIVVEDWAIYQECLWRREGGGLRRVGIMPLTAEAKHDFQRLGVREIET